MTILFSSYKFVRHPPVVHVELVLLEEALGGGVLGLHSGHELVQLSPLLPHCPGHVLRDLSKVKLITNLQLLIGALKIYGSQW